MRRAAKEPDSVFHPVLLLNALEAGGDLYTARRLLYQNAPASDDRDILSRWANVEDWYGSEAPDAYSRLLKTLIHENASKEEILEICSRGLQVGLPDEQFDAGRRFAAKSADLGDSSGLEPLQSSASFVGVTSHDWDTVWESVRISDLYFLGKSLVQQAPAYLWTTPALIAMKTVATLPHALDLLGPVAPDPSGSTLPRLQRYEPYEEYEHYSMAQPIAERVAELKLDLAWLADSMASRGALIKNIRSR